MERESYETDGARMPEAPQDGTDNPPKITLQNHGVFENHRQLETGN